MRPKSWTIERKGTDAEENAGHVKVALQDGLGIFLYNMELDIFIVQ